jgi:hypothetical protein
MSHTPTTAPTVRTPVPPTSSARPRLSVGRGIALGLGTLLTGVLPVSFGVTALVDLLSGTESDHRFHQITGQGVLLAVLWLGGLVPLILAGWRRRVPSVAAGLRHLAVVAGGVVAAALAPGNGGAVLAVVLIATGALLWAALPARPPLAGALRTLDIDPVLAPIALLAAALLTPYLMHEAALQRAMADEHAKLSHYFDMAWVSTIVILFALLAAALRVARRLMGWAAGALLVLGGAALAFTDDTLRAWLTLLLGVAAVGGALLRRPGAAPADRADSAETGRTDSLR